MRTKILAPCRRGDDDLIDGTLTSGGDSELIDGSLNQREDDELIDGALNDFVPLKFILMRKHRQPTRPAPWLLPLQGGGGVGMGGNGIAKPHPHPSLEGEGLLPWLMLIANQKFMMFRKLPPGRGPTHEHGK